MPHVSFLFESEKKYRDSYALLKKNGKLIPVLLNGFRRDVRNEEEEAPNLLRRNVVDPNRGPDTFRVLYEMREGAAWKSCTDSLDEVEVFTTYPETGYFNTDKVAMYLIRRTKRQWRRTISDGNAVIFNPNSVEVHASKAPLLDKDSSIKSKAEYMFFRKWYSPEECVTDIEEGNALSRAFNPRYAIVSKSGFTRPTIFYKKSCVGIVDERHRAVLPASMSHLLEDLSQYMECVFV